MANDLAFDEVHHVFGNVRGVIGDALHLPHCREQMQQGIEPVGLAMHLVDQMLNQRLVGHIDRVIFAADLPRELTVEME